MRSKIDRRLSSFFKVLPVLVISLFFLLKPKSLFADKNEVVVWHGFGDEKTKEVFDNIVERYRLKTATKIRSEYIPYEQIKTALMKITNKTLLPELIIAPADFVSIVKLVDLSPVEQKQNIAKDLLATVSYDGKIYGMPITQGNHLFLYYNRQLVKTPINDFQDMSSIELPKGTKPIGWNFKESFWFLPFFTAFGGEIFDDKFNETMSTAALGKSLEAYYKIGKSFDILECDYACGSSDFYEGKYAFAINGIWALNEAMAKLGDNLGVAVLPRLDKKILKPLFATKAVLFPGKSLDGAHKDTLKDFANHLQSVEVQERFADLELLPVHPKLLKDHKSSVFPAVIEQLSEVTPTPNHQRMNFVWEGLRKSLLRYGSYHKKNTKDRQEKIISYMAKFLKRSFDKEEGKTK